MPRKPRFYLPGVAVHAVQRGHSREPVFYEDQDYRAYLNWLTEAAGRYQCAVHAYVLMTNHVHILATPKTSEGISRMMQYAGRRYVPYINYHYGTSGTLWEGRYKASLVHETDYLLTCMRYIELNPVRATVWCTTRGITAGRVTAQMARAGTTNSSRRIPCIWPWAGRMNSVKKSIALCSRHMWTRLNSRRSVRPGKRGRRWGMITSGRRWSANLNARWDRIGADGLRKGL
ncbi:MAG: transposase [Gammaproteobacteria bacterium]|nr:transposase [Gammaproteobacteria bacterium]